MIRIENDDRELKQALDRLSARLANMTQVMHRIAQVMDEGTRQHFAQERGPDGQSWQPLADCRALHPSGLICPQFHLRCDQRSLNGF
ncbi:MAG: phage virion morphogenesis protein [Serpentinimonas sp.]|nr:phage virion morphogenesis protein [Serpentinimonas sp.]